MKRGALHIDIMPTFKVGDPAPKGYLEWHEWARVQHRGGLRQSQCTRCHHWLFPQQLDTHVCLVPVIL